jgi:DNA-binding response OmpR family regulator
VADGSEEIFLAPKEMLLLEYFLKHKGEVISRAMLAVDVWKYDKRTVSLDNMIDVQISRLREKIDRPYSTKLLHTVRGVGFILKESG